LSRAYAAPLAYIDGTSAPGRSLNLDKLQGLGAADRIHRRGWTSTAFFRPAIVCQAYPANATAAGAAATELHK